MTQRITCGICGHPRRGAICMREAGFDLEGCIQSRFRAQTATLAKILGVALLVLVVGFGLVAASIAFARDADGRYAQSPLKPWFDQLKSGKGLCCSDADGSALSDSDWETKDGHYRVRVPARPAYDGAPPPEMVWVDVPDDAVITEPNRVGRTMVWPIYGYMGLTIRCFMPGSMS